MSLKTYLGDDRGRAAALAEKAGISKSHLSLIKNGRRKASWPMAKAIEKATGGKVKAVSLLRTVRAAS